MTTSSGVVLRHGPATHVTVNGPTPSVVIRKGGAVLVTTATVPIKDATASRHLQAA